MEVSDVSVTGPAAEPAKPDAATTAPLAYAEDIEPGTSLDLGQYTITLAEIVEFSRQWDPQDFHTNPSAAGYFGEVIASGLHSMAILQRLLVLAAYRHWAILAGRRIADARFPAPARPGMTLRGSLVIDSVELRDEEKALVTARGKLTAGDEVILTITHELYMFRRPRS